MSIQPASIRAGNSWFPAQSEEELAESRALFREVTAELDAATEAVVEAKRALVKAEEAEAYTSEQWDRVRAHLIASLDNIDGKTIR